MRLPPPYDRLLLPIYLPSSLMAVSTQAMFLLLPLYALEISGSAAFAAFVVGLRGVGVLVFDLPAGLLVGRFGDRRVMLGGLGLLLAATLGLAVASDPMTVALLAIPYGGGTALWLLGRQSYIIDSGPIHERGRAVSVMAGVQRAGAFVGPALGGLAADTFGYGVVFGGLAGLAAVGIAVVTAFTQDVRPQSSDGAMSLAAIGRVVADHGRIFATAGSATLGIQLMRASRQLLVPLFGNAVGLAPAAIGLIYSLSAVVDMSLFYPVGIVMDRYGRKWSGVPSMIVFSIALAVLPLAAGFWSLLAAGVLLGVANGLGTGIVMVMGMDLAPDQARGQFLGVWRLFGDVGGVGGPLLAGLLVDVASLAAASLAGAGLGAIGALILAFWVPETLHHRRRTAAVPVPGGRDGDSPPAPR